MAEERNLGVARAPEADEDYTKAELQRRMEEARESITQTVTEIKDTVANQYQSVRDSVSEALDWREQFRKRPVAWTVGALGVGVVVGYSLGGALVGDGDDERDYPTYDESDVYARTGATPTAGAQSAFTDHRSYASHAITSGPYGSSEYAAAPAAAQAPPQAAALTDSALDSRPSYSSGYEQAPAETEEDKPGLMERFKETRAYDRLQEEVSELGNRFMDELSNAARTIVLPALFNKIKEMVGVDLSNKQQQQPQAASSSTRQAMSAASASAPSGTQSSTASASSGSTGSSAQPTTTASSSGADSRSKFERLAEDSGPSTQSESSLRNMSGYDDRYERESQLYARSENRGFGAQGGRGESQSASNDAPGSTRDDNS